MKLLSLIVLACFSFTSPNFQAPTWKKEQLMSTLDLSNKIKANAKDKPLILNIGPMENIKGAIALGAATNSTFKSKAQVELAMENKIKSIVVYCGCCSYASCPNIKPAYDALIELGFKNTKVLELPEGIKPDWVAKGYQEE